MHNPTNLNPKAPQVQMVDPYGRPTPFTVAATAGPAPVLPFSNEFVEKQLTSGTKAAGVVSRPRAMSAHDVWRDVGAGAAAPAPRAPSVPPPAARNRDPVSGSWGVPVRHDRAGPVVSLPRSTVPPLARAQSEAVPTAEPVPPPPPRPSSTPPVVIDLEATPDVPVVPVPPPLTPRTAERFRREVQEGNTVASPRGTVGRALLEAAQPAASSC